MQEIILFQDKDFRGHHVHIFFSESDLRKHPLGDNDCFNDKVSSFIIKEGTWEFWEHIDFKGVKYNTLGKGNYADVSKFNISDNKLSSLKPV